MTENDKQIKEVQIGECILSIPDCYQQIKSMPDDPPDSIALAYRTNTALCVVLLWEIESDQAMPFDDVQQVIDGIHGKLGDNQGLIEVVSDKHENSSYIYSIVKTVKVNADISEGIQYTLTIDVKQHNSIARIQGFFDEVGMTGVRDNIVFSFFEQNKSIEERVEDWQKDPYDSNYASGIPMNKSEEPVFDDKFPNHPLSLARRFAKVITSMHN